jgi:hypothetical protein
MAQAVIPTGSSRPELPGWLAKAINPRFASEHPVLQGANSLMDLFLGGTEEEQANQAMVDIAGPLALASRGARPVLSAAQRALRRKEGEIRRWFKNQANPPIVYRATSASDMTGVRPETTLQQKFFQAIDDKVMPLLERGGFGDTPEGRKIITEGVPELANLFRANAPGSVQRIGRILTEVPDNPNPARMLPGTEARAAELGLGSDELITAGKTYGFTPEATRRTALYYRLGLAGAKGSERVGVAARPVEWENLVDLIMPMVGNNREQAELLPRLWAALSPNSDVFQNSKRALQAWKYHLEHPEKMGKWSADDFDKAGMGEWKFTAEKANAWNVNVQKAIENVTLGGPKVRAMLGYMLGEPSIPIDTHAIAAMSGTAEKLNPMLIRLKKDFAAIERLEGLRGPTGRLQLAVDPATGKYDYEAYGRLEQALRDTLQSLDPDRTIHEIFATYWEGVRYAKGLEWAAGPIKLYRDTGLFDIIGLVDPDKLAQILKHRNWSPVAIGAIMYGSAMDQMEQETMRPGPTIERQEQLRRDQDFYNEPLPDVYG